MNVLRMVKMFGWERLMNERIAEKREEELSFIKRMRLLDLATMLTKCVFLHHACLLILIGHFKPYYSSCDDVGHLCYLVSPNLSFFWISTDVCFSVSVFFPSLCTRTDR